MATAQSGQPTDRRASEARAALTAGRAADALRLADASLQLTPTNRDAADVKIRALLAGNDSARARAAYDSFVKATGKEDGGLLRVVATGELKAIAGGAGIDAPLRVSALDRLTAAGDASAKAELQRMSSEGGGAGVVADGVLARHGDVAAARRLADAAVSPAIRDKSIVARAIESANAQAVAYALVPLLRDESPVTRVAAIDAISALHYERAIGDLRALVTAPEPGAGAVAVHAAVALKRFGDPAGDDIIAALLTGPAVDGRLAALEVSPSVKPDGRAGILKAALADEDPVNRVKAAQMLARDDPAAARGVLINQLKGVDLAARVEAARALDTLASPDLAILHGMLADSNGWVRMYAAGGVMKATTPPRPSTTKAPKGQA